MKLSALISLLILSACSKVDLNEYSYEDSGIREVSVKVLIIEKPNGNDLDKPCYAVELTFDNYVKGDVLGNVTWECESRDGGRIDYYNVNFNIPCNGLKCETILQESVYWWSLLPDKIKLVSIKCNGYIFKF